MIKGPVQSVTRPNKVGEASFTLIETVIALSIMAFLIIEVSAVQGNAIVFADYGRNVTQASWLGKRVMSQVEHYWQTKPFSEIETEVVERPFEDFPEYSYSLAIKEWKFPFIQLLAKALGGGQDGEEGDPSQAGVLLQEVEGQIDQIFGDEPIFMTANVEVSWAEGAGRNSTKLTYLLTNQSKLDQFIGANKAAYEKITRPPKKDSPRSSGAGSTRNSRGNDSGPGDPNARGRSGTDRSNNGSDSSGRSN